MKSSTRLQPGWLSLGFFVAGLVAASGESPFLYGIHDHEPNPSEYLNHISAGTGSGAWVTATAAVGANTNDTSGVDFTFLENAGHTVICRINHGYFPNGTIPLPAKYDDFAARCASFVAQSPGCHIWVIGNELNIAGEWPYNPATARLDYVSPSNYAACFRKVYNAIKAVRPNDKVLPQAPAPFSGPYGQQSLPLAGTNYLADANPLNWVQHLNQVLSAITNTGPLDGIALHVYSRGYTCADVQSTAKFASGGGAGLYRSFFCYKDWIDFGIPAALYSLPLYVTECNGYYFWSGGHPEDTSKHYEAGWVQAAYEEINRHNQNALMTGKPVFRCINLYRWCAGCDGWNIDGSPYKSQILADLDQAVARKFTWPTGNAQLLTPIGLNFMHPDATDDSVPACEPAGVVAQRGWNNLTSGGTGSGINIGGSVTVSWSTPGGGTHGFSSIATTPGDNALVQGYLDTGDTSTTTVTVSGLKFPLYDVIVYSVGDNGGATRVGKYTLNGTLAKYIRDDGGVTDFSGSYIEADSTSGGAGAPSGNYCRFRNVRGGSFSLAAKGDYASDGHPRAPLNAIQIVPVNVVPQLSAAGWSGGQFQCFVNGATNANYIVQGATNLTTWTPLRTNAAPFYFTDTAAGNFTGRLYRALFQ